jgi:hypothetical protein
MSSDRGVLDYSFSKDRLSKGWSYPVKRSKLDEALTEAGVSSVCSVGYTRDDRPLSDPHRPPLEVQYHGEEVPYAIAGLCVISVKSVPSESRHAIATALEERLADIARWIAGIPERDPTWRAESHSLAAIVSEGNSLQLEERGPYRQ